MIIFYLCFLFSRDAEEKVKKSVDRILGIWEERAVYSKHFIEQIRLCKPGGIIGFEKQYEDFSHTVYLYITKLFLPVF